MTTIDYAEYANRRARLGAGRTAFVTHEQYRRDQERIVDLEAKYESLKRQFDGRAAWFKQQLNEIREQITEPKAPPAAKPEKPSALAAAVEAAITTSDEEGPAQLVTCREIKDAVCAFYCVDQLELLGIRRTKQLFQARMVAMWLSCKHTPLSLPAIGRHFGGRDHTTVIHARNKLKALLQSDETTREQVKKISHELGLPF